MLFTLCKDELDSIYTKRKIAAFLSILLFALTAVGYCKNSSIFFATSVNSS